VIYEIALGQGKGVQLIELPIGSKIVDALHHAGSLVLYAMVPPLPHAGHQSRRIEVVGCGDTITLQHPRHVASVLTPYNHVVHIFEEGQQ